MFPDGDAIGKRVDFGDSKNLEIVGVVNSASLWMAQSREPLAAYLAVLQMPAYNTLFVDLRTAGDRAAVLPAARRVLESMGRHLVLRADTLEQRSDWALVTDRIVAMLSSYFGGLALLLASIGLYGLMSYSVSRRTSEIGVRMALGARPAGVLGLILTEVLWLVLGGVAAGVPIAILASRFVSGMVYGVTGSDPATLLVASVILLAVAGLAGYVPARRASRIDPMVALRSE